ncbi:MAG: hypothetical protein CL887_03150 [Dehalococcoidia bacterium]|nr:hypothetical protein [Dehalococcoidia bacterium]
MRNLPLFPLNTVLFPGGTIPLQVFEPRYLRLIDDCLNSDSKFGVVLIKEGKEVGGPSVPMSVGTIAKITSIKNLPNNRLLVTSIGTDRFNILEILKDDPYMVATVDVQNEQTNEEIEDQTLKEATRLTGEYLQTLLAMQGGWIKNPSSSLPEKPLDLSFFMAQLIQQPTSDQQKMLETTSTINRLSDCTNIIKSESQKLVARTKMDITLKFSRN